MHGLLSTPDHEASLNFMSNIILLERYDGGFLEAFQRAIDWLPGAELDDRAVGLRALLKHEATHFLDLTTTAWGGQYMFRKSRMLRIQLDGADGLEQARDVFALESGELALHSALLSAGAGSPSASDTIQHQLLYHEDFGVCVLLHYIKDTVCHHKVPVSMLSLLEANATASEFLSLLQCAESRHCHVERQLAKDEVERRFAALLDDPARLEYSCLLHLTRVHFRELGLGDLLRLVAAVARFSLDASSFALAAMANRIEESFHSKRLGHALAMELRRDASRQVIFFKTILFMYGWLQLLDNYARAEMLSLIRTEPAAAVRRMWKEAFDVETVEDHAIREFSAMSRGQLLEHPVVVVWALLVLKDVLHQVQVGCVRVEPSVNVLPLDRNRATVVTRGGDFGGRVVGDHRKREQFLTIRTLP
jgi:hypothetical protein